MFRRWTHYEAATSVRYGNRYRSVEGAGPTPEAALADLQTRLDNVDLADVSITRYRWSGQRLRSAVIVNGSPRFRPINRKNNAAVNRLRSWLFIARRRRAIKAGRLIPQEQDLPSWVR